MNAENGSAIFGKQGIGQIIIDPVQKTGKDPMALIYSSNYYDNYKEDGLPSSYSKPSETYEEGGQTYYHQGMLIDLTTPQIRFRSGKFEVNSEGHLTAKGGGSIAGWEIGDNTLSSDNGKIFLNSAARNNQLVFQAGNNFKVQANGIVNIRGTIYATSGEIGDFKIDDSIYNDKSSIDSDSAGVYIGSDGIALGANSTFVVDSNGNLTATNANIKGEINATKLTAQNVSFIVGNDSSGTITFKDLNGSEIGSISGWKDYDIPQFNIHGDGNVNINGSSIYLGAGTQINGNLFVKKIGMSGNLEIGDSNTSYTITLNGGPIYAKFK